MGGTRKALVVMRWLYLSIVLLCSCTRVAPWPDIVERTVIFDQKVPEAYRAAVMASADKWNDAADSDLLISDDGNHLCHVFVLIGGDLGSATRLGNTRPIDVDSCSLIVRMKPDMSPARIALTAFHELGHVLLGTGHSDDKESVMYPRFVPGAVTEDNPLGMSKQRITRVELDRLTARMSDADLALPAAPLLNDANDECGQP